MNFPIYKIIDIQSYNYFTLQMNTILQNNKFSYNDLQDYTSPSIVLEHIKYTSSYSSITYSYKSYSCNSIVVLKGTDSKISGIGGGPNSGNSLVWQYIPANSSGTKTLTNITNKTELFRIVI